MTSSSSFPPIARHGVIGDRRTAALVAADATINWFCVPDYDDQVIFGSLLDPTCGGFFRFGPEVPSLGEQSYDKDTVILRTRWKTDEGEFELTDFMPWPERQRPRAVNEDRVIVRRLRAVSGSCRALLQARPRQTFDEAPKVKPRDGGVRFRFKKFSLALWTSFPLGWDDTGAKADFLLKKNEEAWAVFGLEEEPANWNVARCRKLERETKNYWEKWSRHLKSFSFADKKLRRAAITVHLMAHAPNDAVVAAATTSLPERIGGDRNYDYRYTWVRDASLSAAFLAVMGGTEDVAGYFDWLSKLDSVVAAPLQVCYRTDGQTRLPVRTVKSAIGYRESHPVQFGNRAYKQRQLGSLGWFADSALIFLEAGGKWKPAYWKMIARAADYTCGAWREKDSGVWELGREAHYVASKVMAWVTLDRGLRIGQRLRKRPSEKWRQTKETIRREVLERGWSDDQGTFRQRYDSEAIDAASLLIPLMNFLPAKDPRVLATIETIEKELLVDGLVYRFDPRATLGDDHLPLGEFEGAFLPATFWYAHALAGAGRKKEAEKILRRCEELAGGPGIFAEEADPRNGAFLGNTPLLFSQVEYGRALLALRPKKKNLPNENKTL